MIKKKEELYPKWLNSKCLDDNQEYRKKNREVKSVITRNKNEEWERKYQEIDRYTGRTRSSEV